MTQNVGFLEVKDMWQFGKVNQKSNIFASQRWMDFQVVSATKKCPKRRGQINNF